MPPPHKPLAVHADFLAGESKRDKLHDHGLWHDDSEHFVRRAGYLATTACDPRVLEGNVHLQGDAYVDGAADCVHQCSMGLDGF